MAILAALKIAGKAAKRLAGQKKLTKGQQQVKKATNDQRVTKNTRNKGRVEGGAVATGVVAGTASKAKDVDAKKVKDNSAFGKAFAKARKEGKKIFIFNGQPYNTKLKKS